MEFRKRLKELREKEDWNQNQLAERIGVSQKTISSWETGRTEPTIGDVVSLCNVFRCTIEQLTGIRQHSSEDIKFEDIIFKLYALKEDELRTLIKECQTSLKLIEQQRMARRHLEELKHAKALQEKQLKEYEKEIEELKKRLGES